MAVNIVSNSWTYTLNNNTLVIDKNYGFTIVSILATTGACTVTGSLVANGTPSAPIILAEGQAVNISSGEDATMPVDGITITTAGVASIVAR
jgi:hypothetical protein